MGIGIAWWRHKITGTFTLTVIAVNVVASIFQVAPPPWLDWIGVPWMRYTGVLIKGVVTPGMLFLDHVVFLLIGIYLGGSTQSGLARVEDDLFVLEDKILKFMGRMLAAIGLFLWRLPRAERAKKLVQTQQVVQDDGSGGGSGKSPKAGQPGKTTPVKLTPRRRSS